jgi:hypothetical protein
MADFQRVFDGHFDGLPCAGEAEVNFSRPLAFF